MVYDQQAQKIYFFQSNQVLVFYKDIYFPSNPLLQQQSVNTSLSPWSKYTTSHPNKFNTQAAAYIQYPDSNKYTVYWGDSFGNIFNMNGVGLSGDAGKYPIEVSRTTRLIDGQIVKNWPYLDGIIEGKAQYRRYGTNSNMSLSFLWSDELATSLCSFTIKGDPGGGMTGMVSHQTFSPSGKGSGFYLNIDSISNTSWMLDRISLY